MAGMPDTDDLPVAKWVERALGDLTYRSPFGVVWQLSSRVPPFEVVVSPADYSKVTLALSGWANAISEVVVFALEVQALLGALFNDHANTQRHGPTPLPRCPLHDHALVAVNAGSEPRWVCPDGVWSCQFGGYEDSFWPFGPDADQQDVTSGIHRRLHANGVEWSGYSRLERDGDDWVLCVTPDLHDDSPEGAAALLAAMSEAVRPVRVRLDKVLGNRHFRRGGRWVGDQANATFQISWRAAEMLRFAEEAVARWSDFPAADEPRPIVMVSPEVRVDHESADFDVQGWPMTTTVQGSAGVPEEPVRLLREWNSWASVMPSRTGTVTVAAAETSVTEFFTDRGRMQLPAWRLEVFDSFSPIWILAEQVRARCWSPPAVIPGQRLGPHMLMSATVEPDGHTLNVEFVGGKETLLEYDATAVETPTAVTVIPLERAVGRTPPVMTLEGHHRRIRVLLTQPLGARCLVNLDGSPVAVVPA